MFGSKKQLVTGLLGVLTMFVSLSIFAQNPPPSDDAGRRGGPDRGHDRGPGFPGPQIGFRLIGPEGRFGGKVVKGAPYSATVTTEYIQTLSNGTHLTRTNTATVYRDGEGRTRQETTIKHIGPIAAQGDGKQIISITDPVAGFSYVLNPEDHTALKRSFRTGSMPPPPPPKTNPEDVKTESLGTQNIEGVSAEGTRTTFTIPAGKIGNDHAIEIVSERWYSPELQVVVLSKHIDPMMGESLYKLTNIVRSEPAHSLFELPADYTVKEGFGGPRRGAGGTEGRGKRSPGSQQ